MAHYLITGASGFLGRHLLRVLQQEGCLKNLVLLLRNKKAWFDWEWTQEFAELTIIEGQLEDWQSWIHDPSLDHLSGIFHLAALVKHSRADQDQLFASNVEGTAALVRAAAEKKARLVFVSTSGTVGCFKDPLIQADESFPYMEERVANWPYYASKIAAEKRARSLARELAVSLVILRPPMLLGPGDHRQRSTAQILRFLQGRLPVIVDGGIHYVDIRDVARAAYEAMRHPQPQEIYHLPGTAASLKDFFDDLALIAEVAPPRLRLPYAMAKTLAQLDQSLGVLLGRAHGLGFMPDPVVIEMASHHWGLTEPLCEARSQFCSSTQAGHARGHASFPPRSRLMKVPPLT
jgi:dihydroflavonol-4-reductase